MHVFVCIHRYPVSICMYMHESCFTYQVLTVAWVNCLWFQPGTTAPFPEACTAARTRAISWACAIVRASQARAVPCSTSTRGPWSGPMTTRPLPLEKEMGINSILCEPASDGLPESFLRRPANFTCTYSSHTENTLRGYSADIVQNTYRYWQRTEYVGIFQT